MIEAPQEVRHLDPLPTGEGLPLTTSVAVSAALGISAVDSTALCGRRTARFVGINENCWQVLPSAPISKAARKIDSFAPSVRTVAIHQYASWAFVRTTGECTLVDGLAVQCPVPDL